MNKRLQNDGGWKVFNVEEIEDSFIQFFKAVEKNAKGKYRIIYEDTKQLPNDYLVHYNIISLNNETIFCHDKVIDIVRDLMANARKYTPFGGQIDASLTETETEIAFEVKDNGYGIPSDEIEKVVEFGYRASNMQAKKTMGGGFGLTKAYYFVKYNDGRFWIDSELNKGTTIKFVIPKP
jgi:signal transduction histidine kinase